MPVADPAPAARTFKVSPAVLGVLAVVAVLVYASDRISKFFVVEQLPLGASVPFLGEVLQFHYVENPGAAFSLGSGTTWIFAVIASAVAIFIIVFARKIRSKAWGGLFGLLLGGTLGNLTDRLTRPPGFGQGHVVDFLQLIYFPAIFNVADMAIVASMGLFIILTARGVGLDGTHARSAGRAKTDETDQPAPIDPA